MTNSSLILLVVLPCSVVFGFLIAYFTRQIATRFLAPLALSEVGQQPATRPVTMQRWGDAAMAVIYLLAGYLVITLAWGLLASGALRFLVAFPPQQATAVLHGKLLIAMLVFGVPSAAVTRYLAVTYSAVPVRSVVWYAAYASAVGLVGSVVGHDQVLSVVDLLTGKDRLLAWNLYASLCWIPLLSLAVTEGYLLYSPQLFARLNRIPVSLVRERVEAVADGSQGTRRAVMTSLYLGALEDWQPNSNNRDEATLLWVTKSATSAIVKGIKCWIERCNREGKRVDMRIISANANATQISGLMTYNNDQHRNRVSVRQPSALGNKRFMVVDGQQLVVASPTVPRLGSASPVTSPSDYATRIPSPTEIACNSCLFDRWWADL